MESPRSVYSFFLALFSSLLLVNVSLAQKTYTLEELPRSIRQAVNPTSLFGKNEISSTLQRQSSGSVFFDLQLETLNGFYIYEDSVKVEALSDPYIDGQTWELEILETPETHRFLDPVSKKIRNGYKGQAVFKLKATLRQSVDESFSPEHRIPFKVRFQACSTELCLLPAWVEMSVSSQGDLAAEPHEESFLEKLKVRMLAFIQDGELLSFQVFLLLFLAGLLTSFTPCVYPIYPITLGIFGKWSHENRFPSIFLVLSYCAGITASYALFGVFSVATGSLFASISQSPAFLLTIGGVILLSALLFSEILPLPFTSKLQNAVNSFTSHLSHRGVFSSLFASFAMGASLGLVASPCVGPVLVALLAWLSTAFASGESSYTEGFLLLSSFGAGMSLPFLVLGHLMLKMKKRVQLGKWTPIAKHAGTALLLVSSLFFIVPGIQLLSPGSQATTSYRFPTYTIDTAPEDQWWIIDFRADWCTACLRLERETFSAPPVQDEIMEAWAFVKVDLTQLTDELQEVADRYNVISLPAIVIVNSDGKICKEHNLYAFESSRKFLQRLDRARNDCN